MCCINTNTHNFWACWILFRSTMICGRQAKRNKTDQQVQCLYRLMSQPGVYKSITEVPHISGVSCAPCSQTSQTPAGRSGSTCPEPFALKKQKTTQLWDITQHVWITLKEIRLADKPFWTAQQKHSFMLMLGTSSGFNAAVIVKDVPCCFETKSDLTHRTTKAGFGFLYVKLARSYCKVILVYSLL